MDPAWQRKGATLSDSTARKEYALTQWQILRAIQAGELHYRRTWIYGNPCLRLLRREVETFVAKTNRRDALKAQQTRTELARISRELRRAKMQIAKLEKRKAELIGDKE